MIIREDRVDGGFVSQQLVIHDAKHFHIALMDGGGHAKGHRPELKHRLADIREKMGANNPDRPKYWETRRPKHLLTGKTFGAACGGALAFASKTASIKTKAKGKIFSNLTHAQQRGHYCNPSQSSMRTQGHFSEEVDRLDNKGRWDEP